MAAHSDEDKINPYEDEVNLQYLLLLCNYNGGLLCSKINKKYLSTLRNNPVLALLSFKNRPIEKFFTDAENDSQENTAYLLKAILFAESNSTFHKINIHAALTPMDLKRLMNPAMEQAQKLQQAFSSCKAAPVVTVSKLWEILDCGLACTTVHRPLAICIPPPLQKYYQQQSIY